MTSISAQLRRVGRAQPSSVLLLALMMSAASANVGCGDEDGTVDEEIADGGKADAKVAEGKDATLVEEDEDAATDEEVDAAVAEDVDAAITDMDASTGENDAAESDAAESDAAESDAAVGDAAAADAAVAQAVISEIYFQSKALSAAQSDRLVSAAFGPDGKIYAAGYVTDAVPDTSFVDRKFAVARFNVDGSTDTTFGVNGVATLNVVAATTESDTAETAKGVAVQSDGKVVVVGTVQTAKYATTANHTNATSGVVTPVNGTATEVDIVVARFTAQGVLDATTASGNTGFSVGTVDGRDGLALFSLGSVVVTANASNATPPVFSLSSGNDDVGGVAIDSKNRVVVFARAKAPGARTDFDRYVVRLTRDGAFDTSFASNGQYVYSSQGAYNENARTGTVLANDGIVSAGYTNIDGKNTIVVARVDENGNTVAGFGNYNGGTVINPFVNVTTPADSGFCEAYAAAVQSDGRIVTTGYGKVLPSAAQNSLLSIRLRTDGKLDSEYGSKGYYTELDALNGSTADFGPEQGRNAIALPDDRILMVGNGTPAAGPKGGDGLVVLLSKDGTFDTTFNTRGHKTYDLGLSGDQLWGAAVAKDGKHIAVVGYSAATPAAPASELVANENSALIIYKIGD